MAEAPSELEARIAETRADLEDKLARLESRTKHTLSVSRRMRERPWAVLGARLDAGGRPAGIQFALV